MKPNWMAWCSAALASTLPAAADVTVTSWCQNSARVQISPPKSFPKPSAPVPVGSMVDRALVRRCSPLGGAGSATGNLKIESATAGELKVSRVDTGAVLFTAAYTFGQSSVLPGYVAINLTLTAGDSDEKVFGLGQGDWNQGSTGCATPRDKQVVVPIERNGQTINLHQRKFFVAIPFVWSTAGYGLLFNMPGSGSVTVGEAGTGGMQWSAAADTHLDFWVTTLPTGTPATVAEPIYSQYADATGHAPALREDAMIFWQSRNRYMTSKIALAVAANYSHLELPVGVLVIDYKNQVHDGDFQPDPTCFPDIQELSNDIRQLINATTVFSFWPEVLRQATEFPVLQKEGCLINSDLGGLAIDPTTPKCRNFIWDNFLKPRYFDKGITAYWLDETDGEGTAGGDGVHGYDTSYGPAAFASNLWVNDWLSMFTDPLLKVAPGLPPMVLTRGVWAGGQRHGIVLWSSDIESTFEELTSQVPQGVHASMSGIPWWTTDVGGYGCGFSAPQNSPYMRELIIRWYQFGCFSPVFRTHGCRYGHDGGGLEPNDPCVHHTYSCGANEVWSYGPETQEILEQYIHLRAKMKHYIAELAQNVTERGVPTMRPLSYMFPEDKHAYGINDQYMLGDGFLVAPITVQNATQRRVYFPKGVSWTHIFTREKVQGGTTAVVDAPLRFIPVYQSSAYESSTTRSVFF